MTHAPVPDQPFTATYDDLTGPLRAAIAEAEELIRSAPFVRGEADLLEGYDYLSGRVRMAVQMAFDHDLARPLLINSTHQYSRQGLDNPDALYWSAYLSPDGEYVVRGRRGTTADLSFQVLGGGYSDAGAPESLVAFDDRELEIAADGSFTWAFGPLEGAKTLIVREVYSDWEEDRGSIWIERVDTLGRPAAERTAERMTQRWEIAGTLLVGSIRTWLAFPTWFTWSEPPNTLTPPATTPGGLASQWSSLGHYALADDEALVVTVPVCVDGGYQAIQIGSDWYASTDYETHQTSLTTAQAHVDDDGVMRCVVTARDPGLANWLETTGHPSGPMMLRWQRLDRALTAADGPRAEVVPAASLASRRDLDAQRVTPEQWTERIVARQRAVARRMLS